MANNRRKGHNAEREVADMFRKAGYANCVTSRYASRKHDDAGIDLVEVPFNVQIKAGVQKGMNPSKVLRYTRDRVSLLFGDDSHEASKENILIHRKDVRRGQKRDEYDCIVSMSFESFLRIIKSDF